jgi:flagellar FliL protein
MTAPTATKPTVKKEEAEEPQTKAGGKKKLLVILAVILLAAGAGAYFFLFSGSGKPAAPTPGAVVTVDPVAVNLAGGGYLKVGVGLQLTADAGEKIDVAKAQDLLISTFSMAKPADVNGSRDALKAALEKKIVAAYTKDGKEMVMGIYLTQYVTQ